VLKPGPDAVSKGDGTCRLVPQTPHCARPDQILTSPPVLRSQPEFLQGCPYLGLVTLTKAHSHLQTGLPISLSSSSAPPLSVSLVYKPSTAAVLPKASCLRFPPSKTSQQPKGGSAAPLQTTTGLNSSLDPKQKRCLTRQSTITRIDSLISFYPDPCTVALK